MKDSGREACVQVIESRRVRERVRERRRGGRTSRGDKVAC